MSQIQLWRKCNMMNEDENVGLGITRVDKRIARDLYQQGQPVWLQPVNVNAESEKYPPHKIHRDIDGDFEKTWKAYEHEVCVNYVIGRKTKFFIEKKRPVREIEIGGSHGSFWVNAETGRVTRIESNKCCKKEGGCWIESVRGVNLKEWEQYWKEPVPDHIDCLDVGYWDTKGEYIPPNWGYRQDVKEGN